MRYGIYGASGGEYPDGSGGAKGESNKRVRINMELGVESFCWASLSSKMKSLEGWVGMCKQMGGRWNSKWVDDIFVVEIIVWDLALKGMIPASIW